MICYFWVIAEPENYTISTSSLNTPNITLGQDEDFIIMDPVLLGNSVTSEKQ